MERLAEHERDFVLRLVYEEQPVAEVAADLGISLSTVYSRRWKLQTKLARMIQESA
jgi:DNA-directed RNA polymerase specialized sigma24 family protein